MWPRQGWPCASSFAVGGEQAWHWSPDFYTSKLGAEGPQHAHPPEHSALAAGDVSINPNASCIVMTTEILRSMIYRCLSPSRAAWLAAPRLP